MELHILLAGVEFGPYTDEQARELLGEGFLNATDPAKRLDETDWLPLNEVLAQSRAVTPPQAEPVTELPVEEDEAASAPTSATEEEPEAEPPPVFEWPTPEMPAESVAPKAATPAFEEAPAPSSETAPSFPPTEEPAPSRKISEPVKPSASSRVRRELTEAEKTSFLRHLTKALPAAPTESAPAASTPPPKAPQLAPEKPQPATKAPPTIRSASAPPTPTSGVYLTAPILTTGPLVQSVTSKAKKTRTGALLAQESLRAAREQRGILDPTGTSALEPITGPSRATDTTFAARTGSPAKSIPAGETTTSAPPKKVPVVLRGREETQTLPASQPAASAPAARAPSAPSMPTPSVASQTAPIPPSNPATTQRKAIKLTGRITLPGLTPKPELPQSKAPSLSGPLVVSRPARTGVTSKIQPNRPAPAPEKSPALIGEIARPADVARQELATGIAQAPTPPPLPVKEAFDEPPASMPAAEPASEEASANPLVRAAGEETVSVEPATASPAVGSVAALLQAAGSEAVAETETGTLPPVDEPPTPQDYSESGRLLSTGELAERRSLKITGSLKHSPPRLPIRLSSPSKPPESSRLPFTPADRLPSSALPVPEAPEPPPLPPAPEESLPPRSETGKIPVSAMPAEGIRIRTRRTTGKIPLPEKERAPEPLSARATPPRPLPETPVDTPVSIEKPKALSATPPRAAEGTTLAEEAPARAVVTPPPEPTPPALPKESDVAGMREASAPAPSTETPAALPPDKVRLRKPVKLELSSRSKAQETGRLSLEAFSKMASLDLPGKTTPAAESAPTARPTAAPDAPKSSATEARPFSPPGPTATPGADRFRPGSARGGAPAGLEIGA